MATCEEILDWDFPKEGEFAVILTSGQRVTLEADIAVDSSSDGKSMALVFQNIVEIPKPNGGVQPPIQLKSVAWFNPAHVVAVIHAEESKAVQ